MPDLRIYLEQARQFEESGQFLEALWCYESVLHDTLARDDPPTYQAVGVSLAHLLIGEIARSDQSDRKQRLISRAITILARTISTGPQRWIAALLLAEAHAMRYAMLGDSADLLSANLQVTILDRQGMVPADSLTRVAALRAQLARAAPGRGAGY